MAPWIESGPHQDLQKTKFQAIRQWKGRKQKQFEFRIDVQCCVCGYEFPKSGDFLIYAYGPHEDGYFQTSICSRTRQLSEAAKDIEVLDVLAKDAKVQNANSEVRQESICAQAKKQLTIRLDEEPHQAFQRDCAQSDRKLSVMWE